MRNMYMGGYFELVFHDAQGRLLGTRRCSNGITNGGRDLVLNTMFRSATQIPTWSIGIIDNASFVALGNTDTMGSHSGWIENTDYDESTRQTWVTVAAALQAIESASAALFTFNASVTIQGLFITSSNTKSGVDGTLWATAEFDEGSIALTAGATVSIIYKLLAEDGLAPVTSAETFSLSLGGGQWWGSTPRITFDAGSNFYDFNSITAGNEMAFVFRVRRGGTLSKIGWRAGNISTGSLQLSIEGVDLTDGFPDGTLIAAGATATVSLVSPADDDTWITTALDTPVAVTQGQLIAVVFAHVSGASHLIASLDENLRQSGFPYTVGSVPSLITRSPIIALEYSDGAYAPLPGCFPWSGVTSPQWDSADVPDERGMKIKPTRSVKIIGFWIDFRMVVIGDVEFVLYDTDGVAVLETITHDAQLEPTPGTTMGSRIFMFTQEHTLSKGQTYRLSVKPLTTNDVRIGLRDVASVAVAAAAPGGIDFGYSTRTDGGAWTDTDLQRPNAGLFVTEHAQ